MMKEIAMRNAIVTVLAALATVGAIATPAAAAEDSETTSVTVTYADLDLSSDHGAATLEQRLDGAVKQVCVRPDMRNLKSMTAWEECKASAKLGALDQLSALEPYQTLAFAGQF